MTKPNDTPRVERDARLRWVPIPKMKINPLAQREVVPAWVDHIAADFDLEQIGTPSVNSRDGSFYIIDGQHRIEALKQIGVNGLLGRAEKVRHATGNPKAHCVAAAAVDIINAGKQGGSRLPSWWKTDA